MVTCVVSENSAAISIAQGPSCRQTNAGTAAVKHVDNTPNCC